MPRPRQRACFEAGLKLDINKLAREGLLQPGARFSCTYSWTNSHTGKRTASALIMHNCKPSAQAGFAFKWESWTRGSI